MPKAQFSIDLHFLYIMIRKLQSCNGNKVTSLLLTRNNNRLRASHHLEQLMENHLAPHNPYGEVQLRIVLESFFILIVGVDYILVYVKSREGNLDGDMKKLLTSQKR